MGYPSDSTPNMHTLLSDWCELVNYLKNNIQLITMISIDMFYSLRLFFIDLKPAFQLQYNQQIKNIREEV